MIRYFCIFGCFLLFSGVFFHQVKKSERRSNSSTSDFWQKESAANQVKRIDLDALPYIIIPLENYPLGQHDDDVLSECEDSLIKLSQKKILNLTGKTSTELKETYGITNLSYVDKCDMNYTELVKIIAAYGARLHELGFDDECIAVLESGIDILTDISSNYKLLAELYQKRNEPEKIEHLRDTARTLDSLNKNKILKLLDFPAEA